MAFSFSRKDDLASMRKKYAGKYISAPKTALKYLNKLIEETKKATVSAASVFKFMASDADTTQAFVQVKYNPGIIQAHENVLSPLYEQLNKNFTEENFQNFLNILGLQLKGPKNNQLSWIQILLQDPHMANRVTLWMDRLSTLVQQQSQNTTIANTLYQFITQGNPSIFDTALNLSDNLNFNFAAFTRFLKTLLQNPYFDKNLFSDSFRNSLQSTFDNMANQTKPSRLLQVSLQNLQNLIRTTELSAHISETAAIQIIKDMTNSLSNPQRIMPLQQMLTYMIPTVQLFSKASFYPKISKDFFTAAVKQCLQEISSHKKITSGPQTSLNQLLIFGESAQIKGLSQSEFKSLITVISQAANSNPSKKEQDKLLASVKPLLNLLKKILGNETFTTWANAALTKTDRFLLLELNIRSETKEIKHVADHEISSLYDSYSLCIAELNGSLPHDSSILADANNIKNQINIVLKNSRDEDKIKILQKFEPQDKVISERINGIIKSAFENFSSLQRKIDSVCEDILHGEVSMTEINSLLDHLSQLQTIHSMAAQYPNLPFNTGEAKVLQQCVESFTTDFLCSVFKAPQTIDATQRTQLVLKALERNLLTNDHKSMLLQAAQANQLDAGIIQKALHQHSSLSKGSKSILAALAQTLGVEQDHSNPFRPSFVHGHTPLPQTPKDTNKDAQVIIHHAALTA